MGKLPDKTNSNCIPCLSILDCQAENWGLKGVQDKSTAHEVLRSDHFKEMMPCYPIFYLSRAEN